MSQKGRLYRMHRTCLKECMKPGRGHKYRVILSILAAVFVVSTCLAIYGCVRSSRFSLRSPYATEARSYKGQLHAHSNNSDGVDTPAALAAAYAGKGYSFLCNTDHDVWIHWAAWRWNNASYDDDSHEANSTGGTAFDWAGDAKHYFYIGCYYKFAGLTFDLDTPGSYGAVTWQYWDGADWTTLTPFQAYDFRADGSVMWSTRLHGWALKEFSAADPHTATPPEYSAVPAGKYARYWVRCSVSSVTTTATVYSIVPKTPTFLCIPGVEESASTCHMASIGATAESIRRVPEYILDDIVKDGAIPALCHPHLTYAGWSDNTLTTLSSEGPCLLEIENANVATSGPGRATDMWDIALSQNMPFWGDAVDDCHSISGATFNKAWVVVYADSLTVSDIKAGLKDGNFYSTEGPPVAISVSGNVVTATTDASSTIQFIGDSGRILQTATTATAAEYPAKGNERYIRVEVKRDSDNKYAWSQPVSVVSQHGFLPVWGWVGIASGAVLLLGVVMVVMSKHL